MSCGAKGDARRSLSRTSDVEGHSVAGMGFGDYETGPLDDDRLSGVI